jgi:2-methylaconitate cis-trans-isomerase PrpF
MTVLATLDAEGNLQKAAILRTARKLFDGTVFGRWGTGAAGAGAL